MSTSRGSVSRQRPQKYQNKSAFKNDLHDTSHRTKLINSLEVSGVCQRCKDIIEWKIKYKKYKPLTAPKKCTECEQKTIKHAYHLLCKNCASKKKVCSKCCKPIEEIEVKEEPINTDIQVLLKGVPERKRRSVLRYINKQEKITPEIMSEIEDILKNSMSQVSLDDDFNFSSEDEKSVGD